MVRSVRHALVAVAALLIIPVAAQARHRPRLRGWRQTRRAAYCPASQWKRQVWRSSRKCAGENPNYAAFRRPTEILLARFVRFSAQFDF